MTIKRTLLSVLGLVVLCGALSPADAQYHRYHHHHCYWHHHHRICR